MNIDVSLVHQLVAEQFPKWKNLPIRPVAQNGWDNMTFHLGEEKLIRMPSGEEYASQVEKEHKWLPKLAPFLPLSIPEPVAMGAAGSGYPWKWSIYLWLEGEIAESAQINDMCECAKNLAEFLTALQNIDPTGGPLPGPENFYRGGDLATYDAETRRAIKTLEGKIDAEKAIEIWERGLSSKWDDPPVWVHGDVNASNLLVNKGQLSGVIDFGQLCIGDPACDLMIAWTFFSGNSRDVFRASLPLDAETWARGRAWTLWKYLIALAGFTAWNAKDIDEVLLD